MDSNNTNYSAVTRGCNSLIPPASDSPLTSPDWEYFTPGEDYIWENESHGVHELPFHLRFNTDSQVVVAVYSVLLAVAAFGNLSVFVSLIRSRHRKSRMTLMMTNLTVADLIVTFFMIPLEIGWRITNQWVAGNVACKLFLFLRAFGLYLSSNVLVCVSIDRYFAVVHPFRVSYARRRGRNMLAVAWATSFLCSVPQGIVFHVSQHPQYPQFHQCVSFNYFSSPVHEIAYNLFCISAMYFVPLVIITAAYSCILYEILNKTKDNTGTVSRQNVQKSSVSARGSRMWLRRSDITNIERARTRTIKLSITIVAAFVCCWTPYVVMTLWYMFDRVSAETVNSRLQDGLFIMAVSNSCVNPLVYGSYAVDLRRVFCRLFCFFSSNHRRQDTELAVSHILQRSVCPPGKGCVNNNHHCNMESQLGSKSLRCSSQSRTHPNQSCVSIKTKECRETRKALSQYNLKHIQSGRSERAELPEFHSNPD